MFDSDKVRDKIEDLAERGWSVQLHEYLELRLNGHERQFLLPHLSLECLVHVVTYCLSNCQPRSDTTYDGALHKFLVPELLRRLEDRDEA